MEYYCDRCHSTMMFVSMEDDKFKHVCVDCYKIEYLNKMYPNLEEEQNDKET